MKELILRPRGRSREQTLLYGYCDDVHHPLQIELPLLVEYTPVVLVLALLCATSGRAWGGAVGWPGALSLATPLQSIRTFVPAASKGFAYSTSQYINALPSGSYSVGLRPQYSFAPSLSLSPFSGLQSAIYPLPGSSYYPPSSAIYYPSLSPPFLPQAPVSVPGFPAPTTETPAGDSDTAVVDSADSSKPSSDTPTAPSQPETAPQVPLSDSSAPSFPQYPESSIPSLPSFPPISSLPSFPQYPPLSTPSFPSIPQLPQTDDLGGISFPHPSIPEFPSFPQLTQPSESGLPSFTYPSSPQFPSFSPTQLPGLFPNFPPNVPAASEDTSLSGTSSFPGSVSSGGDGDKGLNDEDTISVESA
ncbi:Protein PELPK1 [Eumeta japonica]|uniref:Protein PELPK1 n=1 Tax=Eumeta variegata TaxID=151549 RepID=A0A4C2A638_EUMVA|nr:Protein PELPK1 [Eumeta japonica]